ncbi:hypothetical protein L484_027348 [Morus notabilis]|uniref:Protein BIG GRAIN 1-like B n=1 Tax=Morus notabilis TaxID=981085 RepID=W9QSB6_9ROSA|nr:protein BIG GRAIN 1-like C [Morus notabilis]EXB38913.1 hypothetical protein L484_027348 [Morus notabilis]
MYKKPPHEDTTIPTRRRRTASFSSSLLDAIYRSIDESSKADHDEQEQEEDMIIKKKQSNSVLKEVKEIKNLRRAIMIESWVEKQSIQSSTLSNSGSSSSESVWSSSETDSSLKHRPKAKPEKKQPAESKQSPNPRVFSKTKLKAMKIYGELKKVKQPISPGGRIASFLNSIFNSGNVKKAKMCYVGAVEDVTSEHISKSVSSSASTTFSRSCLSKPQSSRTKHGNNNGNNKRSVRFYPVSEILGEDSQPCGHKFVYEDDPSLMPLSTIRTFVKSSSSSSTSLKEDLRKEKSGERETQRKFLRSFCENNGEADDEEEEEDDDDDVESYSSSDLFELDHLAGIGRYREELPVYETTSLKTNQAIAKGLIL